MIEIQPGTGLPDGWTIHLNPEYSSDYSVALVNAAGDVCATGRQRPDRYTNRPQVAHRFADITDPALHATAAYLLNRYLAPQRIHDAFVKGIPIEIALARLETTIPGARFEIDVDKRTHAVTAELTATDTAACHALSLVAQWLGPTGLEASASVDGVDLQICGNPLTLRMTLNRQQATRFITWLAEQRRSQPIDFVIPDIFYTIIGWYWENAAAEYKILEPDQQPSHLFGLLRTASQWLDTATVPSWCAPPATLRSSLCEMRDPGTLSSVLSQLSDASGLHIICVWDRHDERGYSGHSELNIVGTFGQLYHPEGNLTQWLTAPSDTAPIHPGSPASWIGPAVTGMLLTDLAGGDDDHNYTRHSRLPGAQHSASARATTELDLLLTYTEEQATRVHDRHSGLALRRIAAELRYRAIPAATVEFSQHDGELVVSVIRGHHGEVLDVDDSHTLNRWATIIRDPQRAGLTKANNTDTYVLNLNQTPTEPSHR
ncbi:hypothetical protein [Nocardia carnea]|uniref:hypothetical protein n=1 Tax=Nocardia carnea TaxID=37328 RepID=UPI00245554DA|nr:hypothetical protein [Nocardia carnea]